MYLIKIGGGKDINWPGICRDIASLQSREPVMVVHGANALRNEISEKLSVPVKTVVSPSGISSVFTDQEALDIFLMAYAGLANKKIVALLQQNHVNAVGLSGVDGRLWQARSKKDILVQEGRKVKLKRGNLTGRVEKINVDLINTLLHHSYMPVICSPAISFENEIVNTDNDWAMAIMAESLKIKKIISLFEAPGLLRNHEDENSLISHIERDQIDLYMEYAQKRMKKKMMGAKRALEGGVEIIYWGDGRVESPIKSVLEGNGTIIR